MKEDGMLPMHYSIADDNESLHSYSHAAEAPEDSEDAPVNVPRPTNLPALPESDSDYDDAEEGTQELGTITTAERRKTLQLALMAGHAAARKTSELGGYMGRSLRNNVEGTVNLAQAGAQAGALAAGVLAEELRHVVGSAATSAGAAASSAMQPGFATRTAIADAAGGARSSARAVLEVAGPPVVHGGYLAAEGAKHVAKATVNTVLPAVGHAAAAAAKVTATHVSPAMGAAAISGMGGLASLFGKAAWSLGDVMLALDEASKTKPLALANASSSYDMMIPNSLEDTFTSRTKRTRASTPPPRQAKASASSSSSSSASAPAPEKPHYEYSYPTAAGWLERTKSKGFLVDQIYLRPGWGHLLGVTNAKGYHTADTKDFRKKLLKMSSNDLAQLLVNLDSM